jgi:uncharacterized protein YcbK (DUF882 family)/LysM repeat protein
MLRALSLCSCSAWLIAVCAVLLLMSSAAPARADREHVVRNGQTLGSVAKRYGVAVSQLAAANGMSHATKLRLGQVLKVPSAGTVYVRPGDTLAELASAHQVDLAELAKCNRLQPRAALRVGQRLRLPGYDSEGEVADGVKRWGAPKNPGLLTLFRVWSKETRRIRLFDTRGRVRGDAVRQMRALLRPRLHERRRKDPHTRLLRLLTQVSDHFGGRPLHIISGFRLPGGNTRDTSRHVAGEAVDFRIPGVPLTELRDYCQRFDHVGVGYYPRTQFVHLDVRRKSATWVDWSGAGEAATRTPPSTSAPAGNTGDDEEADEADEPSSEDEGQPPIDDDAP